MIWICHFGSVFQLIQQLFQHRDSERGIAIPIHHLCRHRHFSLCRFCVWVHRRNECACTLTAFYEKPHDAQSVWGHVWKRNVVGDLNIILLWLSPIRIVCLDMDYRRQLSNLRWRFISKRLLQFSCQTSQLTILPFKLFCFILFSSGWRKEVLAFSGEPFIQAITYLYGDSGKVGVHALFWWAFG